MRTLTIASAAAALAACGGGGTYSGGNEAECEEWCDVRAPKEENEGFCPVRGQEGGSGDCVRACEELAQPEPPEPLQECIEDDALCFILIEDCIEGRERRARCMSWCDARASEHEDDGFCEPTLQNSPDRGCESVCVHALSEGLPAQGVEDCLRDDPLCFADLGGCAGS